MRNLVRAAVLVGAAGLSIGLATSARAVDVGGEALARLQQAYPGVAMEHAPRGAVILYGRTMNDGESPAQAANDFVNTYRDVFGAGMVDLAVREHGEANFGALHNFVFAQTIEGLPVEHAFVSVAVRTLPAAQGLGRQFIYSTVLAEGYVARAPEGGFPADTVTAKDAVSLVGRMPLYTNLGSWSEPQLVAFMDPEHPDAPAVRTWKFSASKIQAVNPQAFTFFVNAANGQLVFTRDDIHHVDITGQVVGLVTPSSRPDIAANPPVQQPIGEVKVEVQGTSPLVFAFSDRNGNFTIPWTGTDPVTLRVSVGGGRWNAVTNNGAAPFAVTQAATPGTPASVNLLSAPTVATQAQVNGLYYTNATHNFITDRATIPTLNSNPPISTNVNEASTCNAFYQSGPPDSIHFFAPGGGCVNTAYGSVVNHEYGHYIVNERNLGQGAFGEGFGDCMSVLMNNNDPIIGRDFGTAGTFPPDGAIRHLDGSAETLPNYPCSGEVHFCGEVIGNIVWSMTNNMQTRYGSALGLELTQALFGDWATITGGGQVPGTGDNAAYPGTAIEMLTVDDTDGNIFNGTPHNPQITPPFQARGIPAPCIEGRADIQPGAFIPAVIVTSAQPITVPVTIIQGSSTLVPGSAALKYRFGATGDFLSLPMTPGANPGEYVAHFPQLACGQAIQYYYAVQTTDAPPDNEVSYPPHSCQPGATFSTQATDTSTSFTEDFEVANPAWTVVIGTGGSWIRSNFTFGNVSTGANPTSDTTPGAGINAWITGRDFQATANSGDLDGTSTLTSPAFNLSGAAGATISYQRWFYLTGGNTGDEFRVEVSVDNGATWSVGERLTSSEGAVWKQGGFSLGSLGLTPTATTKLRFVGADVGADSTFEAGIDDLVIATLACNTGPSCDSIDFNGDTLFPDTQDISDFINVFGGGACPTGTCGDIDFNNDGLFPDTADIESLLRVFGGGAC